MTEYSAIKVISKDLVSTLFDKDLKCSRLQYMRTEHLAFCRCNNDHRLVGNVIPGTDTLRITQRILL